VMEKTKNINEIKSVLLVDTPIIKELSEQGYEYATNFLNDNLREVIIRDVTENFRSTIKFQTDEVRKGLQAEMGKVRRAAEKAGDTVTRDEMRAMFNELMASIRVGAPSVAPEPTVEAVPEAKISRPQALSEARAEFDKGNRPAATRKLLQGGFTAFQIEAIFETFLRTVGPSGGASVRDIREAIRDEMRRGVGAGPSPEYDVMWIRNPAEPMCWDNYTLGMAIKSEAEKKLSVQKGIPISEVQRMVVSGEINSQDWLDAMNSISPEEMEENLIRTGKVTIIPRSPEFERRLMAMPFAWGNGQFFKLSPEGRVHSGHASWAKLNTICKVVEENVRTGEWSSQSMREAGIPQRFVNECVRLVRRGQSYEQTVPVTGQAAPEEEVPREEQPPSGPTGLMQL